MKLTLSLPSDHHIDLSMHRYFEHCLRFDLHVRGLLTNLIDAPALRPPHKIDWRFVQGQPARNMNAHEDHLLGRAGLACTVEDVPRAEVDGPGAEQKEWLDALGSPCKKQPSQKGVR